MQPVKPGLATIIEESLDTATMTFDSTGVKMLATDLSFLCRVERTDYECSTYALYEGQLNS